MLPIEYLAAAVNAANNGVFIPLTDLPGLLASEVEAGDADKESKAVLALITTTYNQITALVDAPLAFSMTKGSPSGAGNDLINQNYSMTFAYQVNHASNSLSPIPVPTTGTNSGKGKLAVKDVFPNATKLASGAAAPADGILLPSAELAAYGAPAHAGLDISVGQDNRDWFAALANAIAADAVVRSTTAASALTNSARGSASSFSLPAAFTAATNPTSGIVAASLSKLSFFSLTYSYTIQLKLNQLTQTFDVNHVTA